ncbi:hypothetical protein KY327_03335, partial [Candidatus Woesearchaeota archaeon]|nr:hypothetical protein [Candidatus Woesearchaeota archaeon]
MVFFVSLQAYGVSAACLTGGVCNPADEPKDVVECYPDADGDSTAADANGDGVVNDMDRTCYTRTDTCTECLADESSYAELFVDGVSGEIVLDCDDSDPDRSPAFGEVCDDKDN